MSINDGSVLYQKGVRRRWRLLFLCISSQRLQKRKNIGPTGIGKYDQQVGSAQCSKGWVHDVDVTSSDPYDAENCGIATAMTFLCMID